MAAPNSVRGAYVSWAGETTTRQEMSESVEQFTGWQQLWKQILMVCKSVVLRADKAEFCSPFGLRPSSFLKRSWSVLCRTRQSSI